MSTRYNNSIEKVYVRLDFDVMCILCLFCQIWQKEHEYLTTCFIKLTVLFRTSDLNQVTNQLYHDIDNLM